MLVYKRYHKKRKISMVRIEEKVKTGYASGFLFLEFVKVPQKEELFSSLELVFTTYHNSIYKNDSLNTKTKKLINLLSMYDFIDRVDNQISFAAVKNTVSKWITLLEKEDNSMESILMNNG